MSLVEWSEDLVIGVAVIDADHRKLFSLVNFLYDSMIVGRDSRLIDGFFDALLVYTREHFAHEETLFQETNYPGRASHEKEHEELINQILEARTKYKARRESTGSLEIIGFINRWLIEHIRKSDRKYAPHLKAVGIK
jgi:hemerythrin